MVTYNIGPTVRAGWDMRACVDGWMEGGREGENETVDLIEKGFR